VSNRPCIGRTEVQLAQLVLDSAALLMNVGRRIGAGETLNAAMTPPPPTGSASMQLAHAVHRRRLHARLHLLTLSSTPRCRCSTGRGARRDSRLRGCMFTAVIWCSSLSCSHSTRCSAC
jgi:hypothetical protein